MFSTHLFFCGKGIYRITLLNIYRGERIAKDNKCRNCMKRCSVDATGGHEKRDPEVRSHAEFMSLHDCERILFWGGWRMFLEDVYLQLCGAGRDFYRPRGLVASALFQTDLLPS